MRSEHGYIVSVFLVQIVKIRQLMHTWSAVCCPQINEDDLSPCIRKMELCAVKAGQCKVLELHTGVITGTYFTRSDLYALRSRFRPDSRVEEIEPHESQT